MTWLSEAYEFVIAQHLTFSLTHTHTQAESAEIIYINKINSIIPAFNQDHGQQWSGEWTRLR